MSDQVLYKEFHTLRPIVWILSGLSVLVLLSTIGEGDPSGGWLILPAFVGIFVAQYLASVHRVNRITLTRDRLRVGKERFERTDFDFTFGVQPHLVLSPDEEVEVIDEWKLPPDHELRIAGGSWGRRRGTLPVVLREADKHTIVAIFTRNPQELDSVLTEWLEHIPDPEG